jgi:hypothetical protein
MRRINIFLRLIALSGIFVSCVFYLTRRIYVLNIGAAIFNLIVIGLVLHFELSD